jgi:hypothetical protein
MMNKRKIALLTVALLALAVVCIVLTRTVIYGCFWWECVSQRSFRVIDLDLPDDLFPAGSIVNALYPLSEDEGTLENGGKPIYWDQGSAGYTVFRFSSNRQAAERYSTLKAFYTDPKTKGLWPKPATLTFVSPKADEFYIGCGYRLVDNCGMLARYREYIVEFDTTIDPEMTIAQFEKIVRFIDQQITAHLYS